MEAEFQIQLKRFPTLSISSSNLLCGLVLRSASGHQNLLQIAIDKQLPDGDSIRWFSHQKCHLGLIVYLVLLGSSHPTCTCMP